MREIKVTCGEDQSTVAFTQGPYESLVVLVDCTCLIVSETFENRPGVPHIPYVFNGTNKEEAHLQFIFLVGKLCLKTEDSKYFGCPKWEEHCIAGSPGGISRDAWEEKAREALEKYEAWNRS